MYSGNKLPRFMARFMVAEVNYKYGFSGCLCPLGNDGASIIWPFSGVLTNIVPTIRLKTKVATFFYDVVGPSSG